MTPALDLDAPPVLARPRSEDRLAFAFATEEAAVCGIAELALVRGDGSELEISSHALLFSAGELVSVAAAPPSPTPGSSWEEARAGGIRVLRGGSSERWSLAYRDEEAATGFELEFEPLGSQVALGPDSAFARATGIEGSAELGRVTGEVTTRGDSRTLEARGQRTRSLGPADRGGASLLRRLGVWLDGDGGLVLWAARPRRARAHDAEAVSAFLAEGQAPGSDSPPGGVEAPVTAVDEARVSTTFDRDGHPVRAGLEVWPSAESEYPRRLAGEVVASAAVDIGSQRLEAAFLAWRTEGRGGVGCYELWRET